jgi:hypothetical protein
MRDRELLPGVQPRGGARPSPTYDGRKAVVKARRSANLRDVIDSAILIGIDAMFFFWRDAHIPGLSRHDSLWVLFFAHIGIAIWVMAVRVVPAWRARKIASTWEVQERERFTPATNKKP